MARGVIFMRCVTHLMSIDRLRYLITSFGSNKFSTNFFYACLVRCPKAMQPQVSKQRVRVENEDLNIFVVI